MTNISTTDDLHGHADGEAPGVAAVPSATVTAAGLWCRACGADVHGPDLVACPACQWSLEPAAFPDSVVGLMFTTQGRMLVNKRLGICVAANETEAHIHYSAKETQVVPMAEMPAVDETKSQRGLSPSARLQAAARAATAGELNAKWDAPALLEPALVQASLPPAQPLRRSPQPSRPRRRRPAPRSPD